MKNIKLKIKTGDVVKVIAGNYKTKIGKILSILKNDNRAIVAGINEKKKHMKPSSKNPKGGIISKVMSIHVSNLAFVDPETNESTKLGRKLNDKNKLQRYSKKTGNFIKI